MTALRRTSVAWPEQGQAPDWRRVTDSLLDLVAAVNAGRSLDEILDEVLERAGQLLGSDAGAVYLRDHEAPDYLCVQAYRHLPPEAIEAKPRIGWPIMGLAVASRRPVLITDFPAVLARPPAATAEEQIVERGSCLEILRPGPASVGDPAQQERLRTVAALFRSIVAVPLVTSREAFGTLALYYAESRSPSAEDMYLMGAFADHAALAIENAHLRHQSEQRRDEVEARRRVAEGMRDLVAVVNSTQRLDEVLDEALSQAIRLLGSDAGGIYLREEGESSDLLTARAARGLAPEQLAARIRVGSPVTGLSVKERRPVVACDLEVTLADSISDRLGTEIADRGAYVQVLRMGGRLDPDLEDAGPPRVHSLVREYRAVVAAPLITRDVTHGTISLYYHKPREFTPEEIALATSVADQTALAIENARLREAAEQRLRDIDRRRAVAEGMRELITVLNGSRGTEEILAYVIGQAGKLLDAAACAIHLADPAEPAELVMRAAHGFGEAPPPERIPVGVPPVGLVAALARPIACCDLMAAVERDLAPTVDEQLVEHGSYLEFVRPGPASVAMPELREHRRRTARTFRASLSMALVAEDGPFGVISLYYRQPRTFGDEDIVLATTFAGQVAVALQTARLRAATEQRTRDLEALYRADELLHRSLRLDDVLHALVDVATDILQSDKTSVLVWDEDGERLVPGAVRGFLPESVAQMAHAPGQGITGRVAQSGRPMVVEDARQDPRVSHEIVDPEGIVSLAHVPVTIGREVFGVFGVNYCTPRKFTGDEERLLSTLARKAAVAIENARLYGRAQQAAALEERQRLARELHDAVTQTLFSASLIAEVLPVLWERDPEDGRRRLGELRQLTRGALAEMRGLLLELRPGALTDLGLGELLSQLVEATAGRTPSHLGIHVQGEAHPLPGDVQVALYRLVQEALANVVKHARASQATVSLEWEREGLALLIQDDGRGFDPVVLAPGHLGVSIMRERAQAIGADLAIDSRAEAGTRVRLRWPAPHRRP